MKMYEHPFEVPKLTNDGIVGTDFLRDYGGNIYFFENKVCLDGENRPPAMGWPEIDVVGFL